MNKGPILCRLPTIKMAVLEEGSGTSNGVNYSYSFSSDNWNGSYEVSSSSVGVWFLRLSISAAAHAQIFLGRSLHKAAYKGVQNRRVSMVCFLGARAV